METIPSSANLPVPLIRRLDVIPERTLYSARPGILAIPSGAGSVFFFVGLQCFTVLGFIHAIWWPMPQSKEGWEFAIGATSVLALLILLIFWLILRRFPGFLLAVLRSPFISISVTDRRLLWSLPWMKGPLMEIGRDRIMGALTGALDRRGNGPAAVILVPGDPCADIDGNIHFDRLPDAAAFVSAFDRG
jgi:hypothetical protein